MKPPLTSDCRAVRDQVTAAIVYNSFQIDSQMDFFRFFRSRERERERDRERDRHRHDRDKKK